MNLLKIIKIINRLLFVVVLYTCIIFIQIFFDSKRSSTLTEPLIIPAKLIKIADLGMHSAAASVVWINTIQQVIVFPLKVPALIRTVNELDPKFSYPYAFATIFLPLIDKTDDAIDIAKKGMIETSDWRIPYYLGAVYHVYLNDRKNAAINFALAAKNPDATENAKLFASRYGSSNDKIQQTIDLWSSIYETSNDETVKERAAKYIIHFTNLQIIDKAAAIYKARFGSNPKEVSDLVSKKILKKIPDSPFGSAYYITNDGRAYVK
jgi:hypothetical protein